MPVKQVYTTTTIYRNKQQLLLLLLPFFTGQFSVVNVIQGQTAPSRYDFCPWQEQICSWMQSTASTQRPEVRQRKAKSACTFSAPGNKYGWLQHLRRSIIIFISDVWLPYPFAFSAS